MERPSSATIEDAFAKTEYCRNNLERILNYLCPTFYCLKLIVKILLHGPDGCGKRMLAKLAANRLNIKFCEENVADLFDESIIGTEKKIRAAFMKYQSCGPCFIYLTGYELFCYLEDLDIDQVEQTIKDSLTDLVATTNQPVIFVAATNEFDRVYKSPLSGIFQHNVQITAPTEEQANEIVQAITTELDLHSGSVESLAQQSIDREYYMGNLVHFIKKSEAKLSNQALNIDSDGEVTKGQDNARVEPEGTRWVDIGGLGQVKKEIIDAIQLSIDYPQLLKSGLKRTGILLYGPPGTGKTLLAKAVANECSLKFINVKGPELLDEYVGQSEDNVRKLFQKARASSPSVIFFDEIDSLVPNRGQAGDSGGVMDRMVSQLLAEMDGVGKSDGVFVIAATNRVDLVDPSLLRPGRFDKVLEVPLPTGREARLQILKAITRKMKLSNDVDLEQLESLSPANSSGADFQGLCSRALQRTFDRCVALVESGEKNEEDVEIITTMADFSESLHSQI